MSWNNSGPYYRDGFCCGCFYIAPSASYGSIRHYLPLVQSEFHSTVVSNTLHTTLVQTFSNSTKENIQTCKYTFPLYDGVSVVGFTCRIADRRLTGIVKEKEEAKARFDQAVSKGESAGLLEQSDEASDVFSTSLGNVAADQPVHVEITYIGELKNDAEIDGIRLTIPTIIAPRYGDGPSSTVVGELQATEKGGIKITVDVEMPQDAPIRSVQSSSHPIAVSLGVLSSTDNQQEPSLNKACATLSLGETALNNDFVLMIQAKDTGVPKAILENHPTIQNHRVLSATLVPKFSLPEIRPEIVFVADRSGSMSGNIPMLQNAMRVFLKSLPAGVKYNICSFGRNYSFLWPKSKSYTEANCNESLKHVDTFGSDYGGTETFKALRATIEQRLTDIPLEIFLLTDGDIWGQEDVFKYINDQVLASKGQIRLFPLGIGNGVSHALIEGLARSGRGFAQAVQNREKLDARVVRMLKGSLSPHIDDYALEVKYSTDDDDFEVIDKVTDSLNVMTVNDGTDTGEPSPSKKQKTTISLYDPSANPDKEQRVEAYLPNISAPKLLQAPHSIPSLFSFSRTTVYILMSPETIQQNPTSVIFKATSDHGPLSLEIPIQVLSQPGQTFHQLAARKAVQDLEEGRGWVHDARDANDQKITERFPSRFDEIVKREAVRIGKTFQVANRWCSFVAVENAEEELTKPSTHKVLEQPMFQRHAAPAGGIHEFRFGSGAQMYSVPRAMSRTSAPASALMSLSSAPTGVSGGFAPAQKRARRLMSLASNAGPNEDPYYTPNSDTTIQDGHKIFPDGSKSRSASSWRKRVTNEGRGGGGAIGGPSAYAGAFTASIPAPMSGPLLSPNEKVHSLIALQHFDGSWSAGDAVNLAGVMDCGESVFEFPRRHLGSFGDGDVWATALVVVFLEDKVASEKGVWEMVVEKARAWLEGKVGKGRGLEDVVAEAKKGLDAK